MSVSGLHALNAENFMLSLPSVLAEDEELSALARTAAEQFYALIRNAESASVLIDIDNLPEAVLDILARDFRVDWYDSNASMEQKRRLIKTALDVHRHKGTKAAVETAVSAIVPGATVQEWFEYGGNPFCFRLRIPTDGRDLDEVSRKKLLSSVQYYKNARSRLDSVEYALDPDAIPPAPLRIAPITGDVYIRLTIPAPTFPSSIYWLKVEDDGCLYEYSLGENPPTFALDDDKILYYEYNPETEEPREFVLENGVLYELVETDD